MVYVICSYNFTCIIHKHGVGPDPERYRANRKGPPKSEILQKLLSKNLNLAITMHFHQWFLFNMAMIVEDNPPQIQNYSSATVMQTKRKIHDRESWGLLPPTRSACPSEFNPLSDTRIAPHTQNAQLSKIYINVTFLKNLPLSKPRQNYAVSKKLTAVTLSFTYSMKNRIPVLLK